MPKIPTYPFTTYSPHLTPVLSITGPIKYQPSEVKRVFFYNIWLLSPGYLAETIDDDERGSQEVTVGRVFSHDVLVPQLDWHQSPKQLAQLFNQQVELTLGRNRRLQTTMADNQSNFVSSVGGDCERTWPLLKTKDPQSNY